MRPLDEPVIHYSPNDIALLRQLRIDRVASEDGYQFSLAHAPHHTDMALEVSLLGRRLRMFTDTVSWLRWVESVLSVSSPALIPQELSPILAAWTLAPVASWLERQNINAPVGLGIALTDPGEAVAWQLVIEEGPQRLMLALPEDTPSDWLQSLVQHLPAESGTVGHTLPLSLAIGWRQLHADEWQLIRRGDALLLEGMAAANMAELWLCHGHIPLARVHQTGTNRFRIDALLDNSEAVLPLSTPNKVTVLAVVGSLTLTVGQWAVLSTGDELTAAVDDMTLSLTTPGCTPLNARLIQIGTRLAARVY